jgi:Fe-S cluster assembly ATPase SufC
MLRVDVVQVFVLAGPAGSGRSTLARQLLQDFNGKLAPAALLTNRCVWQPASLRPTSHSNFAIDGEMGWRQLPVQVPGHCRKQQQINEVDVERHRSKPVHVLTML